MSHAVIARVIRSGFVEGEHYGTAVAVDGDGDVIAAAGAVHAPIFPRSSSKPLQAVAMLRAGLDLDGPLLALAASSHSGERYHLDGVQRLLAGAELDVSDLRNTASYPLDEQEQRAWRLAGRAPSSLAQNCSGKHAAMLATCAENGWPLATYLDRDHPLQELIAQTVADLAGEPVAATGVDGCGAPVLAISVLGLACAFARLATAPSGSPEHRVAQAIRRHPEWLGGTGRDVTALCARRPRADRQGRSRGRVRGGPARRARRCGQDRGRRRPGTRCGAGDPAASPRRGRSRAGRALARPGARPRGAGGTRRGDRALTCDSSCNGSTARGCWWTARWSARSSAPGLLVLVGVTHGDGQAQVDTLARKVVGLRILREERSLLDEGAPILLVSQFTLYADTAKGRRPSWSAAAPGQVAEPLVETFAQALRGHGIQVATGRFGADMQVELVNDGPVTLLLEA